MLSLPLAQAAMIGEASDSDSTTHLVDIDEAERGTSEESPRSPKDRNLTWCYDAVSQTSGIYVPGYGIASDPPCAVDRSVDLSSATSVFVGSEYSSAYYSRNTGR